MNILFLNSSKEWGGNEKWTIEATCGLAERGHNVTLGCRSDIFRKKAWNNRLKFIEFPFSNVFDLITTLKIRSFVKKNRIDVVIPTKQREYLLGGIASFGKAKVAARLGIDRPLHNFRNKFAFCKLFDIVIVNSKKIIDSLSKTPGFDTDKCRLIYNGIKIPCLQDSVRKDYRREFNLSDTDQLIVSMGRVAPQKGFDIALKAFSLLHEKAPSVKYVIVGSGSSLDEYKSLATMYGVADKVIFTGYREDTSAILQAGDLFWLTSRSEGMSNALMEAMAHGKAVVAFNVAGVDEVIEDGLSGIIVNNGETEELAERSLELLNDEAKQKLLGKNAFELISRDFSRNSMINNLELVLNEIIR